MAKGGADIAALCSQIIKEVQNGVFRPIYLLMGDEPYYPELVCKALIDNCLQDFEKDFNETIYYGSEITVEQLVTTARRFPMMSERQLVVVKEAQTIKNIEELSIYTSEPLDSTVLVLLFYKAKLDKRYTLYKSIAKNGIVLDSPSIRDYEIVNWIISYYRSRGLQIDPQAAALLGEYAGTELSVIASETEKLLKNLPVGTTSVTVQDIEKNVGISREFSIFELTKELSERNAARALKIADHLGKGAKFAMPMAVSNLYSHFYRILKYQVFLRTNPHPSREEAAAVLGINPYFLREYNTAVRNYSLKSTMEIISMLCEYDYLGKGGDGQSAAPDQLIVELTTKILNS
jgi:DNA polymerase-3 subunit delta